MYSFEIDQNVPKPQLYDDLHSSALALVDGEVDGVANMANVAALLFLAIFIFTALGNGGVTVHTLGDSSCVGGLCVVCVVSCAACRVPCVVCQVAVCY